MSQEFAVRNRILAVELQNEHVLIATDQPYKNEWVANLERTVLPRKIQRVLVKPRSTTTLLGGILSSQSCSE